MFMTVGQGWLEYIILYGGHISPCAGNKDWGDEQTVSICSFLASPNDIYILRSTVAPFTNTN